MAVLNTGTLIDSLLSDLVPDTGPRVVLSVLMLAVDGQANFDLGFAAGSLAGPTLTNINPDPFEQPGDDGAFSIDFRTAQFTPITFEVHDAQVLTFAVAYANRNEVYVIRDVDGVFRWPFDVIGDNFITGAGAVVDVQLLPRGGWPPTVVRIQVANCRPSP